MVKAQNDASPPGPLAMAAEMDYLQPRSLRQSRARALQAEQEEAACCVPRSFALAPVTNVRSPTSLRVLCKMLWHHRLGTRSAAALQCCHLVLEGSLCQTQPSACAMACTACTALQRAA